MKRKAAVTEAASKRQRTDRYPQRATGSQPPQKFNGKNAPFKPPATKKKQALEDEEGSVMKKKTPRGNFQCYRELIAHANYKKLPESIKTILSKGVATEEGDETVQMSWNSKDRLLNRILRTAYKATVNESDDHYKLMTSEVEAFVALKEKQQLRAKNIKIMEAKKAAETKEQEPKQPEEGDPEGLDEDDDGDDDEGKCSTPPTQKKEDENENDSAIEDGELPKVEVANEKKEDFVNPINVLPIHPPSSSYGPNDVGPLH